MTTQAEQFSLDEMKPPASAGLGWISGGVMLIAAVALWSSAYLQLHYFGPEMSKTLSGKSEFRLPKQVVDKPLFISWRFVNAKWIIPAVAAASLLVCAAVRRWWSWGAILVAFPLVCNWYLTFSVLT